MLSPRQTTPNPGAITPANTLPYALYQGAKSQRYGDPHVFSRKKLEIPTAETALKGRATAIPTAKSHFISDRPLQGPYPEGTERAIFGLGCFWGAERKFWELGNGVWVTAVGYAGGLTPNPTYEEVCSGRTGHNEVVLVVYDPKVISYELLRRSGEATRRRACASNDAGTQYRSGIYVTSPEQRRAAEASRPPTRRC
jgi:peptide-methionine (S)-S-oxide reductase